MPEKPKDDKKPKSLIEKGLSAFFGDDEPKFNIVVRERGFMIDTYTANGNVLKDGPGEFDGITCANSASPTAAQVQKALAKLIATLPNDPGSDNLYFSGVDPIAAACNIAPRTDRKR